MKIKLEEVEIFYKRLKFFESDEKGFYMLFSILKYSELNALINYANDLNDLNFIKKLFQVLKKRDTEKVWYMLQCIYKDVTTGEKASLSFSMADVCLIDFYSETIEKNIILSDDVKKYLEALVRVDELNDQELIDYIELRNTFDRILFVNTRK